MRVSFWIAIDGNRLVGLHVCDRLVGVDGNTSSITATVVHICVETLEVNDEATQSTFISAPPLKRVGKFNLSAAGPVPHTWTNEGRVEMVPRDANHAHLRHSSS